MVKLSDEIASARLLANELDKLAKILDQDTSILCLDPEADISEVGLNVVFFLGVLIRDILKESNYELNTDSGAKLACRLSLSDLAVSLIKSELEFLEKDGVSRVDFVHSIQTIIRETEITFELRNLVQIPISDR